MFSMRYGCLRWFEQLGAGLAAVTVNRAVLIWKLARMGFLTRRDYAGMRLGEIQRIESTLFHF